MIIIWLLASSYKTLKYGFIRGGYKEGLVNNHPPLHVQVVYLFHTEGTGKVIIKVIYT